MHYNACRKIKENSGRLRILTTEQLLLPRVIEQVRHHIVPEERFNQDIVYKVTI